MKPLQFINTGKTCMNTDPYGIQQKNRFKNDEISVNYSEQEAKDKCLRDKYTVGKKIEKGRLSGDRLEDGPCKGGAKYSLFLHEKGQLPVAGSCLRK